MLLTIHTALSFSPSTAPLTSSASTPPRGWNSYDAFTMNVNETQFLANCQAMADLLLPHGFDTCVVDYLWYQTSGGMWALDDYCRPIPDEERWPSSAGGKGFRPIADKVHAMGLKFGIHIMRGTSSYAQEKDCVIKGTSDTHISSIVDPDGSCGWKPDSLGVDMGKPGAQAFYDSLYEQYAVDWQVDFIKNDCVFRSKRIAEIKAQARSIAKYASAPGGRPIVYSLSPGQSSNFDDEARTSDLIAANVNMYRITDDDWDHWAELAVHFDAAAAFASRIAKPGLLGAPSFPDLDMLPIGYVTSPGDSHARPDHWSDLTREEQRTQMTLWAIARSPLFFGGDVTRLRAATPALAAADAAAAADADADADADAGGISNASFVLGLLTNEAVLGLNAASRDNRELTKSADGLRVWAATMAPEGRFAVAFFNTAAQPVAHATVSVAAVLNASGTGPPAAFDSCKVSDMWSGVAMGSVGAKPGVVLVLPAKLPAHGSRLLQLVCA